jgi:hypothetical protein
MSLVTRTAHGQQPMQKAPPLQRDVHSRADEHSIRSQTGGSQTGGTPYHRHIHHEKIGDHRTENFHTGSSNTSAVPRGRPGVPIMNGRNENGPDAA